MSYSVGDKRGQVLQGGVASSFQGRALWLLTITGISFGIQLFECFHEPISGGYIFFDLGLLSQWALQAANQPWNHAYDATDALYGPTIMLFLELAGRGYHMLALDNATLLHVAIKLPSVIFDLIGGIVTYAIARHYVDYKNALWAATLFDFNPAIIYDSSFWGQCDMIPAVLALAAVWLLIEQRRTAAWVVLILALLGKPHVVVIAPFFILEGFRSMEGAAWLHRAFRTGVSIFSALLVGWLVSCPLLTDRSPYSVYHRVYQQYMQGSTGRWSFPVTSVDAFNVHILYGQFGQSDATRFCSISLQIWGILAFIAFAGFICRRYCLLRDDRALIECCFLILLAFFLFPTEIHNRYLMYALTFMPVLAVVNRTYLWSLAVLTISDWFNLEYVLKAIPWMPVLVRVCALANIGVFIVVARGNHLRATGGMKQT